MSKTKSKSTGDGDVSETKEKGNDAVSETVKKLGTEQLEQLQRVVKAELRARDNSEERDAEAERLSKMSDGAFKQLVSDLVDGNKSKSKTEE
jgi:hypothetical protein